MTLILPLNINNLTFFWKKTFVFQKIFKDAQNPPIHPEVVPATCTQLQDAKPQFEVGFYK